MPLICLGIIAILVAVLIDTPATQTDSHDHPLTGDRS
jgi:hypothetical protein